MSATPVIFDDGSKAMVSAAQLSAALKDGGKVAQAMTFDDGSKAYVPLDKVHDAIHDGGQLIGAAPQAPKIAMQPQPMSFLERRGAQTAENAVSAAEHVAPLADEVYDVSAPSIATEVAKHLAGKPNNLKSLPPKMVMAWLAAGGLPEAEAAEAAPIKAAEAPVVKAAEAPVANVRRPPDLPAAFQPLPAKAPAVPGTVDAPFQGTPKTLADLSGAPTVAPTPAAPTLTDLQKQINDALGGKPLAKGAPIYNRTKPLTDLQQQIADSAEKPKTTPKAPLTNLQKQIASAANPLPEGFTATPDSSLLKGYKYDAAKQEFSAVLNNGESYVHGEVTPEQVKSFEDAESQGSAWTKKIKQGPGTVLVKKNGVPVKKVQSTGPLEDQLTDMLNQVKSGKKLSDLAAN